MKKVIKGWIEGYSPKYEVGKLAKGIKQDWIYSTKRDANDEQPPPSTAKRVTITIEVDENG